MNIHERSLNVFMNYSLMFLNNKLDIHEIQTSSSTSVVDERP